MVIPICFGDLEDELPANIFHHLIEWCLVAAVLLRGYTSATASSRLFVRVRRVFREFIQAMLN